MEASKRTQTAIQQRNGTLQLNKLNKKSSEHAVRHASYPHPLLTPREDTVVSNRSRVYSLLHSLSEVCQKPKDILYQDQYLLKLP